MFPLCVIYHVYTKEKIKQKITFLCEILATPSTHTLLCMELYVYAHMYNF